MKKVLKWIDNYFEESVLVLLLVVMCVLMFANVVLRYVFSSSIIWSDEVCRYSFVITEFLGVGYCIKKRSLMRMDSIKKALPFKAEFILETFVNLLLTVFFGYYAYTAITTVQKGIKMRGTTEILLIPLWIIYLIVLICYAIATLRAIQKITDDLKILAKGEEAYKASLAAAKAASAEGEGEDNV